jgi:hypothetical protein
MGTIQLTPETISAYKKLITNPKENGLPFDAIADCFEKNETVVAKHELADAYIKHIDKPLPKAILYIIMDDIFGQCNGKDGNGNLGYYLRFTRVLASN